MSDDTNEFPSSIEEATQKRIAVCVEKTLFGMLAVLRAEFGRVAVASMSHAAVWEVLRRLAVEVAFEVDRDLGTKRYEEARQASTNLLKGVFAGIELGKDKR